MFIFNKLYIYIVYIYICVCIYSTYIYMCIYLIYSTILPRYDDSHTQAQHVLSKDPMLTTDTLSTHTHV